MPAEPDHAPAGAVTPGRSARRWEELLTSLADGAADPDVTIHLRTAPSGAPPEGQRERFLTKAAVRLATGGVATGTAREGCPPLADLVRRYADAGGALLVCPICFDSRRLAAGTLVKDATLGGTVPMWEWIGDEAATTFSY